MDEEEILHQLRKIKDCSLKIFEQQHIGDKRFVETALDYLLDDLSWFEQYITDEQKEKLKSIT